MNDRHLDDLISELAAGDGTPESLDAAWAEWRRLAADRPALWEQLAEAQRDEAALRSLGDRAAGVAEAVGLPNAAATTARGGGPAIVLRLAGWGGWALAASLLLAMGLRSSLPEGDPAVDGPHTASTGTLVNSAAEALDAYLTQGRREGIVVEELPQRVLLDRTTGPNGVKLFYLRQILEVREVPELLAPAGVDEEGRPVLVKFQPKRTTTPDS